MEIPGRPNFTDLVEEKVALQRQSEAEAAIRRIELEKQTARQRRASQQEAQRVQEKVRHIKDCAAEAASVLRTTAAEPDHTAVTYQRMPRSLLARIMGQPQERQPVSSLQLWLVDSQHYERRTGGFGEFDDSRSRREPSIYVPSVTISYLLGEDGVIYVARTRSKPEPEIDAAAIQAASDTQLDRRPINWIDQLAATVASHLPDPSS